MIRLLFFIGGLLSLGLGILGTVLPVLPTTPLLLLALYCFSKSSERFHKWLIQSRFYKRYLADFIQHRSMPLKRKIFLVGFASTMLLFPLIILKPLLLKACILCVYGYLYYYFIFQIKTA